MTLKSQDKKSILHHSRLVEKNLPSSLCLILLNIAIHSGALFLQRFCCGAWISNLLFKLSSCCHRADIPISKIELSIWLAISWTRLDATSCRCTASQNGSTYSDLGEASRVTPIGLHQCYEIRFGLDEIFEQFRLEQENKPNCPLKNIQSRFQTNSAEIWNFEQKFQISPQLSKI